MSESNVVQLRRWICVSETCKAREGRLFEGVCAGCGDRLRPVVFEMPRAEYAAWMQFVRDEEARWRAECEARGVEAHDPAELARRPVRPWGPRQH